MEFGGSQKNTIEVVIVFTKEYSSERTGGVDRKKRGRRGYYNYRVIN